MSGFFFSNILFFVVVCCFFDFLFFLGGWFVLYFLKWFLFMCLEQLWPVFCWLALGILLVLLHFGWFWALGTFCPRLHWASSKTQASLNEIPWAL